MNEPSKDLDDEVRRGRPGRRSGKECSESWRRIAACVRTGWGGSRFRSRVGFSWWPSSSRCGRRSSITVIRYGISRRLRSLSRRITRWSGRCYVESRLRLWAWRRIACISYISRCCGRSQMPGCRRRQALSCRLRVGSRSFALWSGRCLKIAYDSRSSGGSSGESGAVFPGSFRRLLRWRFRLRYVQAWVLGDEEGCRDAAFGGVSAGSGSDRRARG